VIPEITDFELRRELLRARKIASIQRLDELSQVTEYLPLTTAAMRHAAEIWAVARQQGKPTSPDPALDVDVILAAQALSLRDPDVIVATTNVGHLSRYVRADIWQNIRP
jgi:predicted nucleic acid-binding protein